MNLPNLNKPVKRNRFGKKIALAGLIPSSEELDGSSEDTEAGDEGGDEGGDDGGDAGDGGVEDNG